jgi:hypothetical protein
MNRTGQGLIIKHPGSSWINMLCLILSISIIGSAQSDNAQISGFVKDITGAVVPQVKVIAKSEGRSFERSAVTNQDGYYVIPNLPPGFYTLTAEQTGFKRFEITNKKLDPSIATTVEIILQTGALTDVVSVVASTASVQTETATVGKLVERQQIELTELNGRNPLFLALTKAGVGGGNLAGLNFGLTTGGFNINGSRGQNNLITFDGAVGIRTRSNATFSIGTADLDSTQEVQILTANYNAEYGRSSGGQIRIVSKSGTRDFHGLFYDYFRNSALNANSWGRKANPSGRSCDLFPADQQCRPSPFRYNQFGYNLNGPILLPFTNFNKDRKKLFWLFSQEWVRERTSTLRQLLVPTQKMRQGDFSELTTVPNPFFNAPRFIRDPLKSGVCNANDRTACFSDGGVINKIPAGRLSQNGMALLRALPEPIPGFTGTGGANWFADRPNSVNQRKDTIAIDFYPTEKHQIRWRAQFFESVTVTAFPFNGGSGISGDPGYTPRIFDLPNRWSSINWVWTISPNWINEMLVSASKDRVNISIDTSNARFQRSQYGITYPYIFPDGKEITDKIPTTAGLNSVAILDGGPYPANSSGPIYQFSNNVTNIRGNHTIKFGVTIERSGQNDFDQINVAGTPGGTNNQNGRFAFTDSTAGGTGTALTNAAIGLFDTYSEIGPRSYTPYRGHMYEWFFQDSWKVKPSLRLELGLRHSIIQPHHSLWGNIVVFDQEFYDPALAVTQDPRTGFITSGDLRARYNGVVIPGDGWPEAARGPGRVPIASTGEFDFLFRGVSKSYSEIHKDNFQPRIGIAYAFNERNVIRAGAGRFFDRLGVSDSVFLGGNPPLQPQVSITAGSVDNPGGKAGNLFPLQITTQDRIFPNPEAWTWNVTFQREIGFATTVDVGYVGRRGLHQQRERNINQLQPGTVNLGGTNPGANPDPLRPFKGFGIIRVTNNEANSMYHSFQVEMNRRFTKGLSYGIAYTLSKSSDDGSAQRDIIPNSFDAGALWGPSDFDRRHVLVANAIYELPFFRGRSSLSARLLGGWTINAVSVFRTGTPFSVTTNQDFAGVGPGSGAQFWVVNGTPERLGQFTDASNPTGQWLQVCSIELAPGQICPAANRLFTQPAPGTFNTARVRNMFRNPGDQNHNLGLFKDFVITESQRIQFRFEAFNWLNHPNWNGVASTDPRDANFGKVNGKGGQRELQFALRYQF